MNEANTGHGRRGAQPHATEEPGGGRAGAAEPPRITVRDNPEKSRYELLEDGKLLGVADYRVMGDTLAFPHTEIVPARRKQGLGELLVKSALDDVRRKGAKVVPYCWFVAEFIEENPEYANLVAEQA